jgi:hypothetical protein
MKISKLTILSGAVFLGFLLYKFLVQNGLCVNSGKLWCGHNLADVMRWGYFFLAFSGTSLFLDNFLKKGSKAWLIYCAISVPLAFYCLVLINSGKFHSPTAGSLGEGAIYNMVFDKIYAFGVYVFFVISSLLVAYVAHRKSKKLAAKAK